MVSNEDAKTVGYFAGVLGVIGIGSYAAYKLFNPSVAGGSCDTPGSPCYTALQPYQQQYQSCANQYAQLMTQIIQGGNAPTAGQQADLDQLRNCMDDASANIAATAKQYVPTTDITALLQYIGEAILVSAVVYYGLKGLGSFIQQARASGKLTTKAGNGAGIAAVIADASVQFAVQSGLINSAVASAWESTVSAFASSDTTELSYFYDALVTASIISQTIASAEVSAYTASVAVDAASTIGMLGFLGYPMYASSGRWYPTDEVSGSDDGDQQLSLLAECGCL